MFIITTTTKIKVYHNNHNKIRSLLYREMISIYILFVVIFIIYRVWIQMSIILNTPPMGRTLSLERRKVNREEDSGLVKRSASWSCVETNWTKRDLEATMSQTKWKSILMCLVLAWKTGFVEKYVAPMLSHQKTSEDENDCPSSCKRDWSHLTLAAALARALYFASMLERATMACFLQLQEMRFLPKKIQ